MEKYYRHFKGKISLRLPVMLVLVAVLFQACAPRGNRFPEVSEGLFDLTDTVTLGLAGLPGCNKIVVHESPGYVNNVFLTAFDGMYYCMWQSSVKDEDTPDTRVVYATSADGVCWSGPMDLAVPTDSTFVTPGGWIQRGETLTAVLNYICAPDRSKGGTAWYTLTSDGEEWTDPLPLRMADGRPMSGILEQDPMVLPDGRTVGAAHFRPGLRVNPVYTDDPTALTGWTEAAFPAGEGSPLEPSQYVAIDGKLVMFFRDQASSFVKLASVSEDQGASWTPPMRTNIPDSRSKQCAGTLPDGRAFWVGNPTGNKSRRALVLALSADGYSFDKAFLLAGPADLPPRRNEGRYKTLGYNYPKAVVLGDNLWISLSINKEDAVLYRVPLKSL
ncbi:MAG: exo-alpha-sialidase [Bacteroidales bacterium]|nr:exo-alpha-sialidase [Bacteroidales bacterium]